MMNSLLKTLGMPCAGSSVLRKGASSVPLPWIAGFLGPVPHSGLGPVSRSLQKARALCRSCRSAERNRRRSLRSYGVRRAFLGFLNACGLEVRAFSGSGFVAPVLQVAGVLLFFLALHFVLGLRLVLAGHGSLKVNSNVPPIVRVCGVLRKEFRRAREVNLQQQVPQFLFVNRNADFWGEGIGHG